MLTDFQTFFHQQTYLSTGCKMIIKLATLHYEMNLRKNRHAAEMSEANCNATIMKRICSYLSIDVSTIWLWLTDEKTSTVATMKNPHDEWLYASAATKKKDTEKTPVHIPVHMIDVQKVANDIIW